MFVLNSIEKCFMGYCNTISYTTNTPFYCSCLPNWTGSACDIPLGYSSNLVLFI